MWMDEASARLFARVLADVDRQPWFVCMTRRDGEDGLHQGLGFDATSVRLEPLSSDVAHQLVHEVTDDFGLLPQDVERLCARAAGNPLYLVELLRAVLDAGSLEDLPDSLEDIIASRIDRLPRRDRRVLRVAAVLGDRFEATLLEELGRQLDIDDAGATAARLGEFLSVDRHDLVFEHDLLRQVAYESLRSLGVADCTAALHRCSPHGRDDPTTTDWRCWPNTGTSQAITPRRSLPAARCCARATEVAHHEASLLLERAVGNGEKVGVDRSSWPGWQNSWAMPPNSRVASRSPSPAIDRPPPSPIARRRPGRLLRKEGLVRERLGRYDAALRWFRRACGRSRLATTLPQRSVAAELEVAYAGVRYRQGKLRNSFAGAHVLSKTAQRPMIRRPRLTRTM